MTAIEQEKKEGVLSNRELDDMAQHINNKHRVGIIIWALLKMWIK